MAQEIVDHEAAERGERARGLIGQRILARAIKCRDYAHFRRAYPDDYAMLLRRGRSRLLFELYELGDIDRMRPPPKPKTDKRLKEYRTSPNATPLIKRAQVLKQAKAYTTFIKFMRSGGDFPKAAKRLGMEEELKRYFERHLHADEVFEEAEQFKSWGEFALHRPRYAAYAEETKMKDVVVRYIAQAVHAKGGKKK